MSTKFDVSIIIVNYNGKQYIDDLFFSLAGLEHEDFTFEVVFEDNASTDGSVEYLKSLDYNKILNLKIIESTKNLGFAGGNNYGVQFAAGEYIVFLNNDTVVESDWLERLFAFISHEPTCVVANSKLLFFYDFVKVTFLQVTDKLKLNRTIVINGKTYNIDNKFCKNTINSEKDILCFGHSELYIPLLDGISDYRIEFPILEGEKAAQMIVGNMQYSAGNGKYNVTLSNECLKQFKVSLIQNAGSGINKQYDGFDIGFCQEDQKKFDEIYEVDCGCGASIIMRKDDFNRCGGFDERFFMYYEDTDLSFRLKRISGKKILYCPSSVVRHIHTGSSKEWSPFFAYHVIRNKLLFVYKNISKRLFFKILVKKTLSGLYYRDCIKLKACRDAFLIIMGKKATW